MKREEKWKIMLEFAKLLKNLTMYGFIAIALIAIVLLLSGCGQISENSCITDRYGRTWGGEDCQGKQTPQPIIKGIR